MRFEYAGPFGGQDDRLRVTKEPGDDLRQNASLNSIMVFMRRELRTQGYGHIVKVKHPSEQGRWILRTSHKNQRNSYAILWDYANVGRFPIRAFSEGETVEFAIVDANTMAYRGTWVQYQEAKNLAVEEDRKRRRNAKAKQRRVLAKQAKQEEKQEALMAAVGSDDSLFDDLDPDWLI